MTDDATADADTQTEQRKRGLDLMSQVYGWEMSDGPGLHFAHTDADDVRRRRELRQRRRRACALIDDFGDCVGSEIENCQSARPFRQPASHRASDVAEPDIAETGHRVGSHDRMTCPPSTLKICPVTQLASSESRNKHMPTRSSG